MVVDLNQAEEPVDLPQDGEVAGCIDRIVNLSDTSVYVVIRMVDADDNVVASQPLIGMPPQTELVSPFTLEAPDGCRWQGVIDQDLNPETPVRVHIIL